MSSRFSVSPRLIVFAALWPLAAALALAEPAAEQLEKDLEFARHLVNASEAAKKIAAGTNEPAKALQRQANDLIRQANEALRAGKSDQVRRLLSQAKLTMFQATRGVGEAVKSEKQGDDFERRRQSVEALLQAQNTYVQENLTKDSPDAQAAAKTARHVEKELLQAQQHFTVGEREDASRLLQDAYLTLKLSLTSLRGGQTAVSSLNFASKEEEYRYELDRNDTHKLLVDTVLKEKLTANPALAKVVDANMKIAADLRGKALVQAGQGDYAAAVQTLEESTGQIIRAIRAAGIYVPG